MKKWKNKFLTIATLAAALALVVLDTVGHLRTGGRGHGLDRQGDAGGSRLSRGGAG